MDKPLFPMGIFSPFIKRFETSTPKNSPTTIESRLFFKGVIRLKSLVPAFLHSLTPIAIAVDIFDLSGPMFGICMRFILLLENE